MAEASDMFDDENDQTEEQMEHAKRMAILEALAHTMAEKRKEAISGRQQSGIEQEWLEDQEFYEGIDDANRAESGAYRSKPPGQASIMATMDEKEDRTSSNVFPNITRPYADAASARVGDMLLPTDDRAWQIKPTPLPELMELADATPSKAEIDAIKKRYGNEPDGPEKEAAIAHDIAVATKEKFPKRIQREVEESTQALAEQEGREPEESEILKTFSDLAASIESDIEVATAAARECERQIDDWHTEGKYHTEMRSVIDDGARLGTGVIKGPVPMRKKHVAFKDGKLIIEEVIKPVSMCVSVWNCFPDPGCGQSIHDGNYFWERDDITLKRLVELKNQPDYIVEMIDAVIEEGPQKVSKAVDADGGADGLIGLARRESKDLYEIWYGYAYITQQEALEVGMEVPKDTPEHTLMPVQVTMINNHIVKLVANHLDTGEYPYDFMVWQKRSGLPYGIGVCRQIRTPQRILTAALRNMMDNAGLAGGPMWAYLEGVLTPIDGEEELAPRKGWIANMDELSDPRLLQHAFQFFGMDMMQDELNAIMQMALKMAEDVTGLPAIMQGQQGSAPDTVGGMNILNNNAGTVLRRIARLFDDHVTEPHVNRYYRYLLQYGENDDIKQEMVIDARGSSALVERDLQQQGIAQMANMVGNPQFGIDPKKWAVEWLKSQRLDPKRFEFDDQEWKELVEQMAANLQKQDSSVQVAEIRGATAVQIQEMKGELEQAKLALGEERSQRDAAISAAEQQALREMQVAFKTIESELKQQELAGADTRMVEQIRGSLAETAMKLQAQFEMQSTGGGEVVKPPVEPAGRAPDGQSFAQ